MKNTLVSFVILTWNSKQYITDCLTSISNSVSSFKYEVIIIDNGSMDNSIDLIKSSCPYAKLISNKCNMGVAFARNQGIKAANGSYIILLDIDTILSTASIDEIIQFMELQHEIGLCAPRLISNHGSIHQNVRRFPTLLSKLCRRISFGPAKKYANNNLYDLKNVHFHFEVDYAVGACQVIRKAAIDEIGLLDDEIFYGPEDIDFCLRLWLNGWKVMYYPFVKIIHHEQRLTQKHFLSKLTLQHIKGLIYYFIKHGYFLETKSIRKKINGIQKNSRRNPELKNPFNKPIYKPCSMLEINFNDSVSN